MRQQGLSARSKPCTRVCMCRRDISTTYDSWTERRNVIDGYDSCNTAEKRHGDWKSSGKIRVRVVEQWTACMRVSSDVVSVLHRLSTLGLWRIFFLLPVSHFLRLHKFLVKSAGSLPRSHAVSTSFKRSGSDGVGPQFLQEENWKSRKKLMSALAGGFICRQCVCCRLQIPREPKLFVAACYCRTTRQRGQQKATGVATRADELSFAFPTSLGVTGGYPVPTFSCTGG